MNKKNGLILIACLLLVMGYNTPHRKCLRYIDRYSEQLGPVIENQLPVAIEMTGKYFNEWPGEHPMTEFILYTWGNTYYGCYYSVDDVPLAFQNADLDLKQTGRNQWTWQSEGDNHGMTERVKKNWYYFKASF